MSGGQKIIINSLSPPDKSGGTPTGAQCGGIRIEVRIETPAVSHIIDTWGELKGPPRGGKRSLDNMEPGHPRVRQQYEDKHN
jgi:hypothetical protein